MLFDDDDDDDERPDENSDFRSHCKMIVLRPLFFIFESHSSQSDFLAFGKISILTMMAAQQKKKLFHPVLQV